jgi:hypothetical protein
MLACSKILLALLVPAASLAAQAEEGPVLKALKASLKSEVKKFKVIAAGEMAIAKFDLASFESDVKSGQDPITALNTLVEATVARLDVLLDAERAAAGNGGHALQDALVQLAGGGALNGEYPEVLYFAHGGLLDDYLAQLRQIDAKAVAQLGKRLRKSLDKAEKTAGLAIGLRLTRDGDPGYALASESQFIQPLGEPLLDFVLSAGNPEVAQDGRVWVSGRILGPLDVHVTLIPDAGAPLEDTVTADGPGRWLAAFTDLSSGNYMLQVEPDLDSISSQVTGVGVR